MNRATPISPLLWHHALRMGCAIFLASVIALFTPLSHSVWIPMTVLFVLGTTAGATARKCIHRFWGTLVGLVIGSLIVYLLPYLALQSIAAIFFLSLAYYFRAFSFHSYGLFVIPVTITIVVIHAIFSPGDPLLLLEARIFNTFIGLAITLLVSFLIMPRRVAERIESDWRLISKIMREYCATIFSQSEEGEVRCKLERALINHRLLFYEVQYERLEQPQYSDYLHKVEEGVQMLFVLHTTFHHSLKRDFREKISDALHIAHSQYNALLSKKVVGKDALYNALSEIDTLAETISQEAFASQLRRFASILIDLDSTFGHLCPEA